MSVSELIIAIEKFAALTQDLSTADLERPWAWQDYDEGLRFAFFRTYEELRELAARMGTARISSGLPRSTAQHILAQHHAAYRDLDAILIGVSDADGERRPAAEEWPLRRTLTHIIGAERSFFAIISDALERERRHDDRPLEMTDEAWETFWAGDPFDQLREEAPLSQLRAYFEGLHERVIREFADIQEAELHTPVVFWESEPMPVEFRLHRFDSHLHQHSIQVEKTLNAIGLSPNEAKRLLRRVYASLAEVEGYRIGAWDLNATACQQVAEGITARTADIAAILDEKPS